MTDVITYQRFWMRRDTAANWTSANPVLASGEWGVETDNTGATPRKFKMGDGITAWVSLAYADGSALVIDSIADADTTHAPSRNSVFDALAAEVTARDAAIAAAVAGLSWKQAVRAATTVAGTLASSFENGDIIDGVVIATGDRVLIKNQAAAADNGIYTVNASGAPTRTTDANSGAELVNASVYVSEGTTLADTQWTCTTNAPITVGSTSLAFAQLATGGGAVPTGTGFPHITAGAQDAAAKLVDTADISADAVTYAKMQNVSAQLRILLRKTAGAGDVEEGTLSELLDFIGSAAQGDILYRGASSWARLAAGSVGQVLKTLGAGANPLWASIAGISGGGMDYIATATVSGAAASVLTMSGLDLATDQCYLVLFQFDNATASTSTLSLFVNGDTTTSNYGRAGITGATNVSGSRSTTGDVGAMDANVPTFGLSIITIDRAGKPRTLTFTIRGAKTTVSLQIFGSMYDTAGNVTSLTFSSSVASALAIGSNFKVFSIHA